MSEIECRLCHNGGPDKRELVRVDTGDSVVVCPTCLRTRSRAKAPRSDKRARRRLMEMAERNAQEVWGSEHVLYLVSPANGDNGVRASVEGPSTKRSEET